VKSDEAGPRRRAPGRKGTAGGGADAVTASMARKLRRNSVPLRRGRNGGALKTGNPGNSGGRPSNKFREEMALLAEEGARSAFMRVCLSGRKGWRPFVAALEYCSNRAWGKPSQALDGQDAEPTNCKVIVEYE